MNAESEMPEQAELDLLRSRAVQLAREGEDEGSSQEVCLELIAFMLAAERYAVEVRHVAGVQTLRELAAVPCTPPFVAGIINVRGSILPVVDLRRLLDLPGRGIVDLHHVILVRDEGMEFGLLADLVEGMVRLPVSLLQTGPQGGAESPGRYLKGVTSDCLVVLDLEKLMRDPAFTVCEEV